MTPSQPLRRPSGAAPRPGPYAAAVTIPAAASPGPRPPRPLGRPATLLVLGLAALTAAGFGGWRAWERAHPGEFTADPRYCELLTPQTVHRLVPTSYGGRADASACNWSAPREEGPNRAGIHLFAVRLTEELARKDLREQRGDQLVWDKDSVADVPGVGDEAFIRFRSSPSSSAPATPAAGITAQVAFRRSNMVVTVAYARPDGDREAARAGAVDAAREAAGRLAAAVR